MTERPRRVKEETGFQEAYSSFARTLRTWLIAYGVGAPVIFFQSPDAWQELGRNGQVRPFVYYFLSGVGIQVAGALAYKTAMWYLYMNEIGKLKATDVRYRLSDWASEAYWLEFALDVSTIWLFSTATLRAVAVLAQ